MMSWFRYFLRIEPRSRSAHGFCQVASSARHGSSVGATTDWLRPFARSIGGVLRPCWVAAALVLDEFALGSICVACIGNGGRESYEAIALFGSLLLMGLFGRPLFRGLVRKFARLFGRY
jgi:hypothetical protein